MSAPVAIIGLGLMGEVYAQRLIDAKIPVIGFDIDACAARAACRDRRPLRVVDRRVGQARALHHHRGVQYRAGRGRGREPFVADARRGFGQDRAVHEHLRSRPRRGARRSASFRAASAIWMCRCPGTSDQVRRGDGVALIGGDMAIAEDVKDVLDALFVAPLPCRQSRRWRPRQARGQSHPWSQPSGAGGRPGLRRAARARSRRVSGGGARLGLLFAGDGDQGAENGARRFFSRKAASSRR